MPMHKEMDERGIGVLRRGPKPDTFISPFDTITELMAIFFDFMR